MFFPLLMNTILTIIISIIKVAGKRTDFNQADLFERLMYLQRLHYRNADSPQKFQDRSSVIEVRQLLENLIFDGKERFSIHKFVRAQGQKNNPPQKPFTTICKIAQNFLNSCPFTLDVINE